LEPVSTVSDASLLNEPQRRHLGVTLSRIQTLLHDIRMLLARPASDGGLLTEAQDLPADFARRAPPLLAAIEADLGALAARFGIPPRERSRYRWVRAVLGSSIDNLEDTRPSKLHPYGPVHPDLEAALDPPLLDLQRRLQSLLRLLESGAAE
jgi:hypothetical protein